MAKQQYDWIESFQRGLGKRVSRTLFSKPISREKITELLYPDSYNKQKQIKPNKVYINRHVNDLCNKWEKQRFIEKIQISKKDRWNRKIKVNLEMLNFEPLFLYFKQKYNIEFSQEEREFLQSKEPNIIRLQWNRQQILKEYPEENILDAIIKFYVKHYSIPYVEFLDKNKKEIWTMTEKHIETELYRAEQLKKGRLKKRRKPSILRSYMKKLNARHLSIDEKREWTQTFERLFDYMLNFKKNPELVSSINANFRKALGIL